MAFLRGRVRNEANGVQERVINNNKWMAATEQASGPMLAMAEPAKEAGVHVA
jgi:hypothetical protein